MVIFCGATWPCTVDNKTRCKNRKLLQNEVNSKTGTYIPKMSVDPCPVGSTTLSLKIYVLLDLFSQPSVLLNLSIMNTLVHFLLYQSCRSLWNVSLGGPHIPFLGLIRWPYHGWLNIMTSPEGPPFQPRLGVHHCVAATRNKQIQETTGCIG